MRSTSSVRTAVRGSGQGRRLGMAVAAGALAVGLSACGSTTPATTTEVTEAKAPTAVSMLDGMAPAAVFARAGDTRETPRAARFTMSSTAAGTPGMSATGAYRRGTETAMRMTIDMSNFAATAGVPLDGKLESVFTGGAMYFRLLGTDSPFSNKWTKVSFDDLGTASGLNMSWMTDLISHADPQSGVSLLLKAADLADLGEETIDGVATHHYRGTVDAATMVANLASDTATRKHLRQSLRAAGVTGSVQDMWVDDDFNIRRSVNRQQSKIGELVTTLTFTGFDEAITITAPEGAEVLDLADLR